MSDDSRTVATARLSPLEPQKTMQERVVDVIRDAILHGSLKPGEQLDQRELAQELNVSRVPVREALRKLEGEELVTFHPYQGFEVTQLSPDEIREIYEIRVKLEEMALELAVPHLTSDLCQELTPLLKSMGISAREDPVRYTVLNTEFHKKLYSPAGRPRLFSLIEMLRDWLKPYHVTDVMNPARAEMVMEQHRSLLEKSCEGNLDGALRALREHLATARDAVVSEAGSDGHKQA